MTRIPRALVAIGVFLVGYASPASATITNIWGPAGEICILSAPCNGSFKYPIRQGRNPTLDIEGQFVDLSTSQEISGSGVTISTTSTSSSHRHMKITVGADAAPGARTITLHYAVEVNGPDKFTILVLRAGKVTSVTAPDPTQYFNDATATFHGDKLDNAGVILLPEKVGTFSVGGQVPQTYTLTQSIGSASMSSSADAQAVVNLHFDGGPFAEAKATVLLFDKQIGSDVCLLHRVFCYTGLDSTSTNESTAHILGPNAVSSITFPLGSSVTPGSQLTARIKLVRPAKSNGDVVVFEVVPSTSFSAAAGSGTAYSATATNKITIPGGDQTKDVTVQFVSPPDGCGKTGCSGKFNTRMVNFNVDALPFLRTAVFTMRTPALTILTK